MVAAPTYARMRKHDAKAFLISFCWEDDPYCPRCAEQTIYTLKDGRMRCGGCAYTFHDFSGRWINRVRLPPRNWLRLLDLFAANRNAREIAGDLMVSYNTVFKALNVIRLAIVCQGGDTNRLVDCRNSFANFCAAHRKALSEGARIVCQAPVFGVKHENDTAVLEILDVHNGHEAMEIPVAKKIWREIYYTDCYEDYDGLIFSCCKTFRKDKFIPVTGANLSLDAAGGFWPFARNNLAVYHCLSPENFPLYLKEQEFRYKHRNGSLVPALLNAVCCFVPNLAH